MFGKIITRGRNSRLKRVSTGSLPLPFPFLAIFFPRQRASLRSADAFPVVRERSDDRKCVCASQANREPVHRLKSITTALPTDVVAFLVWKDREGQTRVHQPDCHRQAPSALYVLLMEPSRLSNLL